MEVKGCHQLFGYNIPQNILFCVQQNKDTLTGMEQFEGE